MTRQAAPPESRTRPIDGLMPWTVSPFHRKRGTRPLKMWNVHSCFTHEVKLGRFPVFLSAKARRLFKMGCGSRSQFSKTNRSLND